MAHEWTKDDLNYDTKEGKANLEFVSYIPHPSF